MQDNVSYFVKHYFESPIKKKWPVFCLNFASDLNLVLCLLIKCLEGILIYYILLIYYELLFIS